MYKVPHVYKNASIMSLNLMKISSSRKIGLSVPELVVVLVLITALFLITAWSLMPSMEFMAICHNIPDGDICQLTIK